MDRLQMQLKSMLSLCRKAGKLVTGESGCENALRSQQARLVIVCTDASDNTKKKFSQKTFFYEVPFYVVLTKNELSAAIGLNDRATVAITDINFSGKIGEILDELQKDEGH